MSDVEQVRDWVGDDTSEARIVATIGRFEDAGVTHVVERSALVILRRRLADLEQGPGRMAIKDDVEWEQRLFLIEGIRNRIGRLERITGEDEAPVETPLPTLTSTPIIGPPTGR